MISRLYTLGPPYRAFEIAPEVDHLPVAVAPGTIIALRVDEAGKDHVLEVADQIQNRVLNAPVGLWFVEPIRVSAIDLIASAGRCGIRVFLVGEQPEYDSLRSQLTDTTIFPDAICSWVGRRLGGSYHDFRMLNAIVRASARWSTLGGVARWTGIPEWRWHREFRRLRLGKPGRWLQTLRVIRRALDFQSNHKQSLMEFAATDEGPSHRAIRRQFRVYLGARIASVRRQLGWEWMIHHTAMHGLLSMVPSGEKETLSIRQARQLTDLS